MMLPFVIFAIILGFLLFDGLTPKKEAKKKTPEEELGEAITKYLSSKAAKVAKE